jgi:glucokinase-like ROK family protein
MYKRPATASVMRSVNRAAVLQLIRERGPISRAEIGRRLHMSLPTVTRIVEQLRADELVRETGSVSTTKGRPGILLEFTGSNYWVLGVDLGGSKVYGTVADLSGHVEHERYVPHPPGSSAEEHLAALMDFVGDLLAWVQPTGRRIRGIGVGVPGMVTIPAGIVQWAPSLQWRNLPLQKILQERFDLPIFVENDLNLTALGELGFGAGRGVRSLVSVAIGTGIGAGIVINGALYRGAHESAGEIGYLPPSVEALGKAYTGFGALESLASATGIVERAQRHLAAEGLAVASHALTAQEVFAAARGGTPWAQKIVAETVDYLSLGLAAICVLLDPELIVLGGGVAQSDDLLIEPIRQRLEGVVPFLPPIVASPLQRRAAAMGAIMLVLNATSDAMVVNQLR